MAWVKLRPDRTQAPRGTGPGRPQVASGETRDGNTMSAMDAQLEELTPPSRLLLLMEGRAVFGLAAFYAALPWLRKAPPGDGHPVMVLPGLAATDASTRPLRRYLTELGYAVQGWELGRNLGRRQVVDLQLVPRLRELRARSGRTVSLIGWSLGGILAREMAKRAPQDVRLVVTMGSPFAGGGRASNVARLLEAVSGRKIVDDVQLRRRIREAPPVPLTSIYSRTDGVVAWRACLEQEGPTSENIEVRGSHCGLGHNPAALWAVADRLAQPEGGWSRFASAGALRLLFPEPQHRAPA
jgi:pimeloyl-ACP methyl ester carboxylesterase